MRIRWLLLLTSALPVLLLSLTVLQVESPPGDLNVRIGVPDRPPILDRHGRRLTRSWAEEWNYFDQLSLDAIPGLLIDAVLVAEDKRFRDHWGVDYGARVHALYQNIRAGRVVRGASTISEQVVRILHPRPRTLWSRWLEGWEAHLLERKLSKNEILNFYLNQVPFAGQRRGVAQASQYYFNRDLSTLNQRELLALAVLIRSPSALSPHNAGSRRRLESRIELLEERLVEAGKLETGRLSGVELHPVRAEAAGSGSDFSTVLSTIREEVGSAAEPIRTTLSASMQEVLSELLQEQLDRLAHQNVTHGGALLLHNSSGEVRARVTATASGVEATHIDTTRVPRPPGSTLKPFVYAAAMERGWTPSTVILDAPIEDMVGEGVHTYHNYSRRHYGEVSLRNALGNSLNIPAIRAIRYVGVGEFIDFANRLGLAGLDYQPEYYGDGLAIGNAPLSLYELATAYAVLARQGRAVRPVLQPQGIRFDREEDVVDAQVASLIGDILSDRQARGFEFGTNSVLSLPHQTAIKTGTSSNYRDAWTFAYNNSYTIGVWMGNLDFSRTDGLTGAQGPAPVVRGMLDWLNRNRITRPLSHDDRLVLRTVCKDDGRPAREGCQTRDEWFAEWMEPGYRGAEQSSSRILIPVDGAEYARDPRTDPDSEAIIFRVSESRGLRSVQWVVNGHSIGVTQDETFRWSLRPGRHRLQARLSYESGREVTTPEIQFRVY